MSIETVKMSSKGQVVIPQDIRESLHLHEGSIFAVVSGEDSVVLKKVQTPSKEELIADLSRIAKEGSKRAKKLGIKESDVVDIVHRYRKSKRK